MHINTNELMITAQLNKVNECDNFYIRLQK